MTTLTPPSAAQIALIDEAARQEKTGEKQAWYWRWLDSSGNSTYDRCSGDVSYQPSTYHPHYATYCQWQQLVDAGEVAKGWWLLNASNNTGASCEYSACTNHAPRWFIDHKYLITKSNKHPDNVKPALKLIDWAKVPIGAMTNRGVIASYESTYGWVSCTRQGVDGCFESTSGQPENINLRLAEQTTFTHLPQGTPPPVVEGLVFEYEYPAALFVGARIKEYARGHTWLHSVPCIYAYRVIGLAPGYTDNPQEAT
jgi:hypothetical protein